MNMEWKAVFRIRWVSCLSLSVTVVYVVCLEWYSMRVVVCNRKKPNCRQNWTRNSENLMSEEAKNSCLLRRLFRWQHIGYNYQYFCFLSKFTQKELQPSKLINYQCGWNFGLVNPNRLSILANIWLSQILS